MLGLGTREIIILAIILVVLFGGKQIPELAKGISEAIRHLRNSFSDEGSADQTKKK